MSHGYKGTLRLVVSIDSHDVVLMLKFMSCPSLILEVFPSASGVSVSLFERLTTTLYISLA